MDFQKLSIYRFFGMSSNFLVKKILKLHYDVIEILIFQKKIFLKKYFFQLNTSPRVLIWSGRMIPQKKRIIKKKFWKMKISMTS